jgi:predicted amidohydrolase YtcJ
MIEAGIPVALSSDCPVERLDAFAAIASAVGRHEWSPEEKLTPMQAIRAYCLGSAYAGFLEKSLASLEIGKLADFVVLSENPTDMSADEIRRLKAEQVFIGGKLVKSNLGKEAKDYAGRTG